MPIDWRKLVLSLIIPQLAGAIGSIATFNSIPTWYTTLVRPEIAPPNWIFGPVWTTLFLLMGIALYLVWTQGSGIKLQRALMIFGAQLVLNTLWSIVFFGMHTLGVAFIEILILLAAIAATVWHFNKISRTAALLLVPYLMWVSFAAYLNYSFWMLNP